MACHEYKPVRFMVEMDERLYDELLGLCSKLGALPAGEMRPRRIGFCLEKLVNIVEEVAEEFSVPLAPIKAFNTMLIELKKKHERKR